MTAVNFSFVLLDLTTAVTPAAMRPAQAFSQMLVALYEQSIHIGQAHAMPSVAFRIGASLVDRQENEIGINFRDTIPEAPGDLAYHQCVAGVPDIEIGVDLYNNLTTDGRAVSVGVTHEVAETVIDPGANQWCAKKDGTGMMGAKEVADPVEDTWYATSNGGAVTNFVLPSYWIPQALGPWDYKGVLAAVTNDEIKKYGYEMQALAPSTTTQVSGEKERVFMNTMSLVKGEEDPFWRWRKGHPYSRATRRGLHL